MFQDGSTLDELMEARYEYGLEEEGFEDLLEADNGDLNDETFGDTPIDDDFDFSKNNEIMAKHLTLDQVEAMMRPPVKPPVKAMTFEEVEASMRQQRPVAMSAEDVEAMMRQQHLGPPAPQILKREKKPEPKKEQKEQKEQKQEKQEAKQQDKSAGKRDKQKKKGKSVEKGLNLEEFPVLGQSTPKTEPSEKMKKTRAKHETQRERKSDLPKGPRKEYGYHQFQHQEGQAAEEEHIKEQLDELKAADALLPREERYRNLMNRFEKGLIAKIQISNLVSEDPFADDFYYQIYTAIKKDDENKPTKKKGNNSVNIQKIMQQQMKKLIDGKTQKRDATLSLEGALGKISMISTRNPKKAIQVGKLETTTDGTSRKAILKSVEDGYSFVLKLEQFKRKPGEGEEELIGKLFKALHLDKQVPLQEPHPTTLLLNVHKGISLIPRAIGFLNPEQVVTLFSTMLLRLECLDVLNSPTGSKSELSDEFMTSIIPCFVTTIGEISMTVLCRFMQIILERHNLSWIVSSRVGLSIMTMLLSRAEILKQSTQSSDMETKAWEEMYGFIFSSLQGQFANLFPNSSEDEVYVWQFLAAMAVGSKDVNHQLVLVSEVREQAIAASKSGDSKSLDNVNLFLNALGLSIDASQLSLL